MRESRRERDAGRGSTGSSWARVIMSEQGSFRVYSRLAFSSSTSRAGHLADIGGDAAVDDVSNDER